MRRGGGRRGGRRGRRERVTVQSVVQVFWDRFCDGASYLVLLGNEVVLSYDLQVVIPMQYLGDLQCSHVLQ